MGQKYIFLSTEFAFHDQSYCIEQEVLNVLCKMLRTHIVTIERNAKHMKAQV